MSPNKTGRDRTSTVTACGLYQRNELLNFPVYARVVENRVKTDQHRTGPESEVGQLLLTPQRERFADRLKAARFPHQTFIEQVTLEKPTRHFEHS